MTARRRWWLIAGLATVAGVAAALALAPRGGGPPLHRVERGEFVRRVVAEGQLRAVEATPVTVPVEVQDVVKIAWLAPDGSRVRAGEVVARLDPSDFLTQREDAVADRGMAREKTAKAEAQRRADLDGLARDAELARREMEAARTFQRRDAELFSRFERLESELDVELAEARRRHAEGLRDGRGRLSATQLDLLVLERRKAEIQLRRAERVLGASDITAPHDGILLLQRDWRGEPMRPGQQVWAGMKLAEIPRLARMEAEVWVLEADAGGLAVGQRADLTVDAAPGRAFAATVRRVDSLARPRMRGAPVQFFGATLEIAASDPEVMKPGQSVRADVVLERLAGVVAVPRQAIFERDGRPFAYRRQGDVFVEAVVELGSADGGRVVVSRGLEPGEWIALRDPHRPPAESTANEASASPAAPAGSR